MLSPQQPPITFTIQGGRWRATISPGALEQLADALRQLPRDTIKDLDHIARMEARLRSGVTVLSQGDVVSLMSFRPLLRKLGPAASRALTLTAKFLEKWEKRPRQPGTYDHFNDAPPMPRADKFL